MGFHELEPADIGITKEKRKPNACATDDVPLKETCRDRQLKDREKIDPHYVKGQFIFEVKSKEKYKIDNNLNNASVGLFAAAPRSHKTKT